MICELFTGEIHISSFALLSSLSYSVADKNVDIQFIGEYLWKLMSLVLSLGLCSYSFEHKYDNVFSSKAINTKLLTTKLSILTILHDLRNVSPLS